MNECVNEPRWVLRWLRKSCKEGPSLHKSESDSGQKNTFQVHQWKCGPKGEMSKVVTVTAVLLPSGVRAGYCGRPGPVLKAVLLRPFLDLTVRSHGNGFLSGSQEISTGDTTVTRIRPTQKTSKGKATPDGFQKDFLGSQVPWTLPFMTEGSN